MRLIRDWATILARSGTLYNQIYIFLTVFRVCNHALVCVELLVWSWQPHDLNETLAYSVFTMTQFLHSFLCLFGMGAHQHSWLVPCSYERLKSKDTPIQDKDSTTKLCSQCGLVKGATAFSPNTTSPDGLRSNCKECQSKVGGVIRVLWSVL